MDLERYATIAGLMLTIIVLIFTVKTYLHAKASEIRGSLESIGETSLSHNLKVKPALEDDGFLHIGVGPTMDVLSPPNWIMAGANWGYIKHAWRLGSTIRTRRGLRIISGPTAVGTGSQRGC